jgi:hypothetical protein
MITRLRNTSSSGSGIGSTSASISMSMSISIVSSSGADAPKDCDIVPSCVVIGAEMRVQSGFSGLEKDLKGGRIINFRRTEVSWKDVDFTLG